ncbi:hypothetical protein BX600DRAFT_466472 [Xylariales sp. PMI_506]|nr:hypothetical protein BX600DRAFT_466472 [Xylariales sp. PMI_506]
MFLSALGSMCITYCGSGGGHGRAWKRMRRDTCTRGLEGKGRRNNQMEEKTVDRLLKALATSSTAPIVLSCCFFHLQHHLRLLSSLSFSSLVCASGSLHPFGFFFLHISALLLVTRFHLHFAASA